MKNGLIPEGASPAVYHALDFLQANVIAKMRDQSRGRLWLASAFDSDAGLLLMFCIALDIGVRALASDIYIGILDCLPSARRDACEDFVAALKEHKFYQSGPCGNNATGSSEKDEQYVRVLEIGGFAYYYVNPRSHRGMGPDEIDEVRRTYFGPDFAHDFSDIKEVWNGNNNRVWVVPKCDLDEVKLSELDANRGESNDTFPGTPVHDALALPVITGYGPNGGPDLVAVHYPPNCEGLDPRQPTAIDADWAARWVYFVSYTTTDGWGRTSGRTGKRKKCRERVHGPYQPLTAGFHGEHIGEAEPAAALDLKKILVEAEERYVMFCRDEKRGHSS